jgi:AraC-like DNA-binding protein
LRLSDQAIESLRGEGVAVASAPVVALNNRRAYLKLRLADATGGQDHARAEALAGALYGSLSREEKSQPLFRATQLSWYAARIERATALINAHYHEPLSLSRMAEDAGMSVYHFARVFHELEGQAPHRRLRDVRLANARQRLLAGASVTDTCYSVGFGSLSHFVSTYRRHFGIRPSDTR